MNKHIPVLAAAVAAASLFSAGVQAGGFKINEQSASGAGRAFAGSAAIAKDASVVFFNPAGMSRLEQSQASFGFTFLNLEGEFKNGELINPAGASSNTAEAGVYNDGGDFMPDKVIPFGYYVRKLDEKMAVGLGIFAPFGTSTDYAQGSLASGFADETMLSAIDIQPTFSYQLTDTFSVGAGLDIVYAKGVLSKELDLVPYGAVADPKYKGYENKFEVSGDDIAFGWNFGLMWDVTPATTLGLAYRSEIEFELEGDSEFKESTGVKVFNKETFNVDTIPFVPKQASRVPLTGPQSATLSVAHQLNDRVLLLAGATWTDWSSFKYFDIIGTEPGVISAVGGLGENYIGHIVEKWRDTVSVSVGAEYLLNQNWTLRAGYAFDESPVKEMYRTARVPDNDRQWLTAGATYNLNPRWSFDAALAYLFIGTSKLNEQNRGLDDQPIADKPDRLTGEYDINALGISFQANYRM
ncbi:porin [Oceanospirillaceae bacterium ASx5O]|nr:porin [Oceanospirillaceae bacterium ASx5O]